jgi:hypothetical protein
VELVFVAAATDSVPHRRPHAIIRWMR